MTIVRRTLVLMDNQGIRAVRQGLVQALGEGLVRTALWAVRSIRALVRARLAARWRPTLDLLRAVTTLPIPKLVEADMPKYLAGQGGNI
jgi:hypothetical protein